MVSKLFVEIIFEFFDIVQLAADSDGVCLSKTDLDSYVGDVI